MGGFRTGGKPSFRRTELCGKFKLEGLPARPFNRFRRTELCGKLEGAHNKSQSRTCFRRTELCGKMKLDIELDLVLPSVSVGQNCVESGFLQSGELEKKVSFRRTELCGKRLRRIALKSRIRESFRRTELCGKQRAHRPL